MIETTKTAGAAGQISEIMRTVNGPQIYILIIQH
jgi:hypothetical protein